jgi:cysteine desulfurase
VREGLPFEPLIRGGGQEKRRRAGTENLSGIVGFGTAARLVQSDLASASEVAELRDRLEQDLSSAVPALAIFGKDVPRLPNTSLFAAPGLIAETLIVALDLDGLAVSAGSACSSGKVTRSHVLDAMDVAPELAGGAIRISLGAENTDTDIDRLVTSWTRYWQRAQDKLTNTKASAESPVLAEVEQ